MQIVPATGDLLRQILDSSHPLWGEGLSLHSYEHYNLAQLKTSWAATRLERVALVEGGRVLSSAKRYLLDATIDRCRTALVGIGAVFTPPDMRGKGFARELLDRIVDDARRTGRAAALLFSEIGPEYYANLGFEVVPRQSVQIRVQRREGAPGVVVRSGDARDLPQLEAISAGFASGYRFALERTSAWIQYGLAKKRLLAGFSPPGHRSVLFLIVEEGGQAAAYVVVVQTPRGWALEECGDRDPSGPRVGALLQVLLAREPTAAHPVLRAWLPEGWLPPQLSIAATSPAQEVMMMRWLGEPPDPPLQPEEILYWHGDVF